MIASLISFKLFQYWTNPQYMKVHEKSKEASKTNHDIYLAQVPGVQSPSTRCTPPSQSSPGAAPRSSPRPPPPPPRPGTWCWHRSSDHPEHCDSVSCSRSTSPSSLATHRHVETWSSGSQGSSFFWQAWNIDLCPAFLTSTLSPVVQISNTYEICKDSFWFRHTKHKVGAVQQ